MMMTMRTVHVTVCDFLVGCLAHLDHVQLETQRHAGQRVIAVEDHLAVLDIGHGEDVRMRMLVAVRRAFELHADLHVFREQVARLDLHQFRVILAEAIGRLDLHIHLRTGCLAVERLLDFRQRVVVAAMQVNHRLTALFDQVALRIRQLVMQGNDRVLRNIHDVPFNEPAGIINRHRKSPVAVDVACAAARYNAQMKTFDVLGSISPREFLKTYWQKKPLLIRQAIPGFQPLLSRDALFELAAQDEVEARLITNFRQQWKMQHGPFPELPAVSRKNWTVLIQGVNLHDDEAERLLNRFRFVPDARLDDLMISYATDTGGVGPHFDSYDVFLLQAQGRRRWRIGAQKDMSLVEGLPVKILRNFTPTQEYVLEPGDMLYLPPQWAHEGVAVGECMTYSIGFRTPSWQELGEAFLNFMADNVELPGRYADPDLAFSKHPAKIGDDMLDQVSRQFAKLAAKQDDIAIFLGEHLTEPKPTVWFTPAEKPLPLSRFITAATKRGLKLHRKSRMLYRNKFVFINGESFQPSGADRRLLQDLADNRSIAAGEIADASTDLQESLHQWTNDGWLQVQ